MLLGMLVVAGPVVVPFALRGPWAFFDNVVLFPLGLSGVSSPAASPLPGHLLVTAFPFLHRALPLAVGLRRRRAVGLAPLPAPAADGRRRSARWAAW